MSTAPALSLYDHVEDVLQLAAACAQAETPEELALITPLLQQAIIGTAAKVDRCAKALAILAASEAAARAELDRLTRRAKLFSDSQASLKGYLLQCMERANEAKFEGITSTIRRQKNPPRVSVHEPGLVPSEFWKQQAAPPPSLDRIAIADALTRDPESVPGCRMEHGFHLRIS